MEAVENIVVGLIATEGIAVRDSQNVEAVLTVLFSFIVEEPVVIAIYTEPIHGILISVVAFKVVIVSSDIESTGAILFRLIVYEVVAIPSYEETIFFILFSVVINIS